MLINHIRTMKFTIYQQTVEIIVTKYFSVTRSHWENRNWMRSEHNIFVTPSQPWLGRSLASGNPSGILHSQEWDQVEEFLQESRRNCSIIFFSFALASVTSLHLPALSPDEQFPAGRALPICKAQRLRNGTGLSYAFASDWPHSINNMCSVSALHQ